MQAFFSSVTGDRRRGTLPGLGTAAHARHGFPAAAARAGHRGPAFAAPPSLSLLPPSALQAQQPRPAPPAGTLCASRSEPDCRLRGKLQAHEALAARARRLPRPFSLAEHFAMTVRTLLRMGDSRLLQVAAPVIEFDTLELHRLVGDLFDTMLANGGVGLAAPQIGVGLQVVIFGFARSARYPDAPAVPRTVLVNPQITVLDEPCEEDWEGCLSVPGLRGKVPRHRRIRYQGRDAAGKPIDREAEGFHARVVQHECDHLIGKLFPMRVRDWRSFGYTDVLFPELSASGPA